MQHHNYSLSDVENMMPWERDIYVQMLIGHIKDENKKIEESANDFFGAMSNHFGGISDSAFDQITPKS